MEESNKTSERFQWSSTKPGWMGKDGEIKPFEEMSESELKKVYKSACHKELVHYNKYMVFVDKRQEMEEEAEKRGIKLKPINSDYHKKRVSSKKHNVGG